MTFPNRFDRAILIVGAVYCASAFSQTAGAAGICERPVARIVALQGAVEVAASGESGWRPARTDQPLCAGDLVTVRENGRAAVVFDGEVLTRLDQLTTLQVAAPPRAGEATLGLRDGVAHFISRLKRRVEVISPMVNALVDGTEFTVSSRDGQGQVAVAEGVVRAVGEGVDARLQAGEAVSLKVGAAPRRIEVAPLDAVKWAIHYPVVLWPSAESLRASREASGRGQYDVALDALPADDAETVAYRANLLLALGRVDEAERLLATEQSADAKAVSSVIEVARNDIALAQVLADQAIALDGDAPGAHLASSYALQASGAPDDSLAAAREATRLAPDSPVAWSRRAELELSLAQVRAGEASAERALALDPAANRAHALLGFAQLLSGKLELARATLNKAVAANSADPLARFALGMTRVRAGEIAAGRADLELAVLLDPSNAEYRATLGRAYMAEARNGRAEAQLALATRIDPATPTPWFFSAQRKLEQGDAIGAVQDGERALALNDNRLTMRSRALLDSDRAARGVTLGAAFQRLRFDGALKRVASDAVSDDSASGPAHQLMAQAYGDDQRLEAARVSEQFQSFIFGDVGQRPVSPQDLMPALPMLTGPRLLSLDETAGLFDRQPWHFSATAMAGTQESWGTNVLASAATEQVQAAVGHFEYRSAGFDPNGDVDLSGTRAELRASPTRDLTLFADLQHRDLATSDITQSFFTTLDAVSQRERADVTRLGLRARVHDNSTLVALVANESGQSHLAESSSSTIPGFPFPVLEAQTDGITFRNREVGLRLDGAGQATRYVAGARRFRGKDAFDRVQSTTLRFPPFFVPTPFETPSEFRLDSVQDLAFGRVLWRAHDAISVDGGLDFVNFERTGSRETERFLPSLGVTAKVTPQTQLRAAYQQGVSLDSVGDQHIEPTRFAGFDALFDDLSGTRYRRLALGIDHQISVGTRVGGQWSMRKLDVPNSVCGLECLDRWDERRHHLFFNRLLTSWLALEVGWRYESLGLHTRVGNVGTDRPERMRTEIVPVRLFAQWRGGWDFLLEGLKVRQDVFNVEATGEDRRHAAFWMANARAQFSPPGRGWQFSVEARNLFDRKALIQDTDLLTGDPRTPLWYPERAVFLAVRAAF